MFSRLMIFAAALWSEDASVHNRPALMLELNRPPEQCAVWLKHANTDGVSNKPHNYLEAECSNFFVEARIVKRHSTSLLAHFSVTESLNGNSYFNYKSVAEIFAQLPVSASGPLMVTGNYNGLFLLNDGFKYHGPHTNPVTLNYGEKTEIKIADDFSIAVTAE
jgi:hypothetical protein